ncbi:hypothetical protein [Arthrobacter globiformis]|uniref:hypothetical protein n=1 Tax=Arthrobacter globiformis TaxID=1665 RepID=UPI001552203A|nr:hypothetical protein [Arthrobacter globiformis]
MNTTQDVTTAGANYMLGYLQMTIAAGESITPEKWQEAIEETVAFQRRIIERKLEPPC